MPTLFDVVGSPCRLACRRESIFGCGTVRRTGDNWPKSLQLSRFYTLGSFPSSVEALMRRLAPVGLASLSTLLCFGILSGCGDNTAKQALTGTDGGQQDGDAASERVDGSPEGGPDTNNDIGEVGVASCTGVAF